MKKVFAIITVMIIGSVVYGQKSIDKLFQKYAGKDGFVTFTVSGNLLKLISSHDDDDDDNSLPADITEIRILVQENDNHVVENFYDIVVRDLNLNDYEEFMTIKESDQDLRMLVRAEGRSFKEFLLIGGGEDNLVIQIKGNMTFKEAKKFSADAKINHGLNFVADHK